MRLFRGGKANDKKPADREPRQRHREVVETAREEQYLKKLSHAFEKGIPTHRVHRPDSTPPQTAPEPTSPPPTPEATPEPVSESPVSVAKTKPRAEESLPVADISSEDPFIQLPGGDESELGEYSFGDIVRLGESTIGVYNRFIPEKEYDVVFILRPDGSMEPQGIPLAAHGAQTIGRLPAGSATKCCTDMVWDRDLIVFHLYEFSSTTLIPHPSTPRGLDGKVVETHHATETPQSEHRSPLVRGRRFSVMFGDRRWEAIYWGHDEQGALVAHNTTGEWSLMHLDLRRFDGSIEFHEVLSREDLSQIEQNLLQANGEG
jgi:hypothetical protein